MRIMTLFAALTAAAFLLPTSQLVAAEHQYLSKVGERVTVFENQEQNYRISLEGEGYTYVNFSERVPDASFAALRFRPNAFAMVIVESIGRDVSAEDYANLVQRAMEQRLADREDAEYIGDKDIGVTTQDGLQVFQKVLYAKVATKKVVYVVSAMVDGARAFHTLTFLTSDDEEAALDEASTLLSGFSIIDRDANNRPLKMAKSVEDYRSRVFGYRFRADDREWFSWDNLENEVDGADIGALTSGSFGANVMPVCWQGPAPTQNALYRVMMQQYGEDYPSDFITLEENVSKNSAGGKLFVGTDVIDGEEFLYKIWVVANSDCAYTLGAWGPTKASDVEAKLDALWEEFSILDDALAPDGVFADPTEQVVNSYLLNRIGLHYYEARSYRDAFRYFSTASEQAPTTSTYVTNALRTLSDLEAYKEAYEWLQPKLGPYAENQAVRSWDGWLAKENGHIEKSIAIYTKLFAESYREDDEFSLYLSMLADADRWDDVDAAYERYVADGSNEKTRLLKVQLLSKRGKHEEALALLDELQAGRPFNADLAYERIDVLEAMERTDEVLQIALSLIENGYASLQSYYYKGRSEYLLNDYDAARESFNKALEFSPANATVRDYLDALDRAVGKGDVSTISKPIVAVALPKDLETVFASNDVAAGESGFGANYLTRIRGYEFDGGDRLVRTYYQKVHVLDDNGSEEFSTLEFDYDPSYEQLYVNRLIVRGEDGAILGEGELDSYYIASDEDGYEASTEKTVHLPVPSLVPGATIESVVSISTSVEDGSFPLATVYMTSSKPIGYSGLFVRGKTKSLQFATNNVAAPRKSGDTMIWELAQPMAFRWEPLQPNFDQIVPWVQLGTVGEQWQTVGTEYLEKIRDKLDASKIEERASRLVDGVSEDARKIEILSAYVQDEIRYEAIEFGRRAYIPKSARETLRDRYGDCKDHAVLLQTMLSSVGINASLALVNSQQQVLPALPNTDQFNHMIVFIDDGTGQRFIDTTDKDMRLGELPPRYMAGNHALVLESSPRLIQMPEYRNDLTGVAIERAIEVGSDGYSKITETARMTGYQAAELRSQLRSIETSEMQRSLQSWVAGRYPDAELTDFFVDNVFDAGYDLLLEMEYRLPVEAGGAFDVPAFLEAFYLEFDRVPDRRFPFEFSFPLQVTAATTVSAAPGASLDIATGKPESGESRFGVWTRNITKSGENWEMRFNYRASEERFDPADYREFAEFQRKIIDAVEQPLVLE